MLMSSGSGAATLYFQPNGYRVVRPGAYVLCAVSGAQVMLEALRYWSVERQEAYASAELATRRLLGKG
jgi:hypothetical protein